jgi:glycosyltransferase involved in cell wall biosynthesis
LRLTANYDEALAMGREGRARVERHFDVQAMVARYEALYEMGTAVPNQPRECLV